MRATVAVAGVAALLLLVTLAACGDSAGDTSAKLVPGASVLDHLERVTLTAWPASNLPADVRAVLDGRADFTGFTITADDWLGGGPVPETFRHFLRDRDAFRWRGVLPSAQDGLTSCYTLTHRGREVAPFERTSKDGRRLADSQWWEEETGTAFFWPAGTTDLLVFAPEAPGEVAVTPCPEQRGELARLEWGVGTGAGAGTRPGADWLRRRVTLGEVSRPALLGAAPSELRFEAGPLAADTLRFAVGVLDHAVLVTDGRLDPGSGLGDGVTFAIEVQAAGGERTRVWQRHVTTAEAWVQDAADLSGWLGTDVALYLVSEPGPAGDGDFDYGLWSGLQLDGPVDAAPARPHVVLIDIDTLRADRLGLYGCERDTSPHLDAWAAEQAVLYADATSASSWTLPATASIVTGLAVQQHAVLEFPSKLSRATPSVAVFLRAAGYETAAISNSGFLSPAFGFDRGFDVFDYSREVYDVNEDLGWEELVTTLGRRRSARPLFLFVQTYVVHAPYTYDELFADPEAPYDGPFAGQEVSYDNVIHPYLKGELELDEADRAYALRLYDAGIARLDVLLRDLLAGLDEVFVDEPYMVVITSDHGEEFFEHGKMNHGYSLYDEVLRVPLIVRYPDGEPARHALPASTLDIVPTILDVAGLPVPERLSGRSLRAALPAARPRVSRQLDGLQALHFDGWKLIVQDPDQPASASMETPPRIPFGDPVYEAHPGGPTPDGDAADEHFLGFADGPPVQLFALGDDPREQNNLADADPDRAERMRALLAEFIRLHPEVEPTPGDGDVSMDDDLLEELRQLGYIGDR